MSASRSATWLERRGYGAEDLVDESNEVSVFSCNWDLVVWFFNLAGDFVISDQKGKPKRLIAPGNQDILNSARLLRFKYTREQYLKLKLMISAAVKEFR